MKKIVFIIITHIILLLYSCNTDIMNDNFFYVERKGAKMPVWAKGNLDSKVAIVVLHGGPGASSYDYANLKVFEKIEKKYAVIYWDQRGAGNALGNPDSNTFTINEIAKDTDLVIKIIKAKYNLKQIFLFGHSWGGHLGTYYLKNSKYQKNIRGWINMDGTANYPEAMKLSRQFVIDYAKKHQNEYEWQQILKWYDKNSKIVLSNSLEHSSYVRKAHGYVYDESNLDNITTTNIMFFGPENFLSDIINSGHSASTVDRFQNNFEPEMSAITIPTLILWGKHDGILPVPIATDYYNALGTTNTNKKQVIFDNSAHSPHYEEPDKFYNEVVNFIKTYK